jgi:hypothetical protein
VETSGTLPAKEIITRSIEKLEEKLKELQKEVEEKAAA